MEYPSKFVAFRDNNVDTWKDCIQINLLANEIRP